MVKNKPLNNQQLTDVVADHELRITKLENKKKKPMGSDNKRPRVTIADVMQTLISFQESVAKFQISVDQRFNKLETSVDERFNKLETQVKTLNQEVKLLNQRVGIIESSVETLNQAVFKK